MDNKIFDKGRNCYSNKFVNALSFREVIVFDLDGTLYQNRWLNLLLTFRLLKSVTYLWKLPKVREQIRFRKFKGHSELLTEQAKILNSKNPEKALHWYRHDFYESFFNCLKPADQRPYLIEVLSKLVENGKKLIVLSDYGYVEERLVRLGIDPDLFIGLFSAEDAGSLKPNLKSYNQISEKLAINLKDSIFVGDRDDTDRLAAKEVGALYISVKTKEEWDIFKEAVYEL